VTTSHAERSQRSFAPHARFVQVQTAMANAAHETALATRPPTRAKLVVLVLAATLFYAMATPWILRPWFLSDTDLPKSELTLGPMEDTDLFLNVWILAWVARAAVGSPSEIFAGNIFHPAPNAIAGSENMLAHLPATATAWALTGDALVVFKAMLFESFVLSGLAMWSFVYFHTRSFPAALLAGAAFTLAPWRVQNVPHPQYLGMQYLPAALLGIDLWIARRRRWDVALLAAALALQALACLYLGYFTFLIAPIYALVRVLQAERDRGRAALGLGVAHVLGAIAAAPVAWPYLVARAQGMIPDYDVAAWGDWSWKPWWYLGAPFLHRAGAVVLVVVALDVAFRLGRRLRGREPLRTWSSERALWAMAAVAAALSAGPELTLPGGTYVPTPYRLLMQIVPGFASLRGPGRFFMVVAAALAALAGFAFARWSWRLTPAVRGGAGLALAAACAVAAAPRPAPLLASELRATTPAVYRWLAAQPPGGAVLELPGAVTDHDVVGNLRNARYMLASTSHWRPLLNGVTGHNPSIGRFYNALTRRLPDPEALRLLTDVVDVDWIVLHRDQLLDHERGRWDGAPAAGLRSVARFGDDEVFAVERPAKPPRGERLLAQMLGRESATLDGLPTAPLAPECRAAHILAVETPPVLAMAPLALPIPVRFANDSRCAWPTIGVRPTGLVGFTYAWTDPSGAAYTYPPAPFSPLMTTIAPGATIDDTFLLIPPWGPQGRWRLDVRLVQWGSPEPLAEKTVWVDTRAFGSAPDDGGDPLPHAER
jgi:hypothetical protein